MDELLKLLESEPEKAIKTFLTSKKDSAKIEKHIKEYKELNRTIRQSQVGVIQKDKQVGVGEKSNTVKAIRSIVPFQKKIVNTACAFEVGQPVTLSIDKPNELFEKVLSLWDENRIDDKIQKAKIVQRSQTEVAIQFYIKDAVTIENKKVKDIKLKLLTNENGSMAPYFDDDGDMTAFTWSFTTMNDDKTVKNTWIWTNELCYKCSDVSGSFALIDKLPHGFTKIPIVYLSQEEPEWYDVQSLIDRYETALSKLGASNDYSGYPLLKLYGTVENMPDRNDDGKTLKFPMKEVDNESGKTIHGDAEFLTNSNAPESVKLEIELLEAAIYSISCTPNLSFDNLKGSIGGLSGVALELLFLDPRIKAAMNEGDNRTMIQRIIKVLISGIAKTTETKLSSQVKDTLIKVEFNSILPNDLKEAIENISKARSSGVMSLKTAVEYLDMTGNSSNEITEIQNEVKSKIIVPTED